MRVKPMKACRLARRVSLITRKRLFFDGLTRRATLEEMVVLARRREWATVRVTMCPGKDRYVTTYWRTK